MRDRIFLLLIIAALALVSPAPIRVWQLDDSALRRVPLSSVLHVVRSQTSADLDSDGIQESLVVTEGHAAIQTAGRTRWQSPQAWQVKEAQITDLNHDGIPEVTLLVWRPFKPWPVDTWLPSGGRINSFHDVNGRSCHMILIGWKRDAFRELWAGSALAEPVNSFAVADLTENGWQDLVTLGGNYDDPPSAPSRRLKVWEWNGFGFSIVNELEDAFGLMVPVQTEAGRVLILTD